MEQSRRLRLLRVQAADATLKELTGFLDSAQRKDGKLTKAAEAGARKVLEAG